MHHYYGSFTNCTEFNNQDQESCAMSRQSQNVEEFQEIANKLGYNDERASIITIVWQMFHIITNAYFTRLIQSAWMPGQDNKPDELNRPPKIFARKSNMKQWSRIQIKMSILCLKWLYTVKMSHKTKRIEEDFVVQRTGDIHDDIDFTANDTPNDMFDDSILKIVWHQVISVAKLIL